MVVEVDVHHHQSVSIALPLSSRHACGSKVGQEERERPHEKRFKVLEVERKFAWDIAYGMDCYGLRIASDTKAVLP